MHQRQSRIEIKTVNRVNQGQARAVSVNRVNQGQQGTLCVNRVGFAEKCSFSAWGPPTCRQDSSDDRKMVSKLNFHVDVDVNVNVDVDIHAIQISTAPPPRAYENLGYIS